MEKTTKITILDKYIFKQVFFATLVCLFLFIVIWIAPETLVRIIRQIFLDGISLKQAGINLLFELPKVLDKAIPVGILLGSIFTFDKLSKNSELIIIRGIGVSFSRIMLPVIVLGVILMFCCYIVSDKLIPYTYYVSGENAGFHKHFVYIKKDKSEKPIQGIIISDYTKDSLKNATIINFSKDENEEAPKLDSIILAPSVYVYDDYWNINEGKKYLLSENGVYSKIEDTKNYKLLEEKGLAKEIYTIMRYSSIRDRGLNGKNIIKYTKLLKKHHFDDERNFLMAKFYQRFTHPLTCILFAILGCLLGYAPPRSQRLVGFTAAVGIIFGYYITLPFFDLLAEKSVLPPIITAIIPTIIFLIIIKKVKKAKDL